MHILVYSHAFNPSIGGMERLQEMLAREFVRMGHGVEVVTETMGQADLPFPVHRRPGFREFLRIARRSDVILAAPLSLRRLPAQLLSGRPLVISQPDTMRGMRGRSGALALLKRLVCRFVTNVVPSRYMAQFFRPAVVIMNPYDAATFHWPEAERPRRDILFVGRIVAWKGVHVLVDAFSRIAAGRPEVNLTIVGDGAERDAIARIAEERGLAGRIRLAGSIGGPDLGEVMRRHAVMVVPSVHPEPFGIVALEGLACGCKMIVSRIGGLPEAVGTQALTFAAGDSAELAARLEEALAAPAPDRAAVAAHLAQFAPERIAGIYLGLLGGLVRRPLRGSAPA